MQNGFQNKYYACKGFIEIIECDLYPIGPVCDSSIENSKVLIMFCKIDSILNFGINITNLAIIGCDLENMLFIKNMHQLVTLDLSSNRISTILEIPKSVKSFNIANNLITDIKEVLCTHLVYLNISANPIWNLYSLLELNVLHLVLFDPTYSLRISSDILRQEIRVFLMKMNKNMMQIDQYHRIGNSGELQIHKLITFGYLKGNLDLFDLFMTEYYVSAIFTTICKEENEISMKLDHRLWKHYSEGLAQGISSKHIQMSLSIRFPFDLLQITSLEPGGRDQINATKFNKLGTEAILVEQFVIQNSLVDIFMTNDDSCSIQLSTNKIKVFARDFFEIVYLDISNQNLTALPSGLKHIKYLIAKNNKLADIPNNQTLVLLDLSDNKISKFSQIIELSHLKQLKYLDIRYNFLKLCDIFGKTILHHLVHYNGKYLHEYKDIDLTILTIEACYVLFSMPFNQITTLQLPFNNIKTINFEFAKYFVSLTTVDISNNLLKTVDFLINNTTITGLILSGNMLESFNIVIDSLLTLDLSFNSIRDMLLIKAQPNLTFLDLERNKISKLQFNGEFLKLTELRLSKNIISQIADIWPLVPRLTNLHLDDNKLSVLNALSSKLTLLNVSNNSLQDLNELYNLELPECVHLNIKGNSLCRFKFFKDYIHHSCPNIKFINGHSVVQLN